VFLSTLKALALAHQIELVGWLIINTFFPVQNYEDCSVQVDETGTTALEVNCYE